MEISFRNSWKTQNQNNYFCIKMIKDSMYYLRSLFFLFFEITVFFENILCFYTFTNVIIESKEKYYIELFLFSRFVEKFT